MSRTVKSEWHSPDGFHIGHKLERQARPAGKDKAAFYADLEEDAEEFNFDPEGMEY